MALRWIIMGLAAATVLALIWYRNRHGLTRLNGELEPGRGITDEAATAFEDVAAQVIQAGHQNYHTADRSKAVDHRSDPLRDKNA